MNIGLKLDDDDKADKGVEEASKDLPVKPSMSTILDTLDDRSATPADSSPS